ncbi:tetratricopeptide repeat protein [Rhizocola hellebori]|nr:tetratricopeptide repeat protein [Rhizocola hellebori]
MRQAVVQHAISGSGVDVVRHAAAIREARTSVVAQEPLAVMRHLVEHGVESGTPGVHANVTPTVPAELAQEHGPGMLSLAPPGLAGLSMRGRDQLVGELTGLYRRRARHAPRVCILYGMGGAGKTSVAASVADRLRTQRVQVWWVSAANPEELHAGMRQLASCLGATDAQIERAWTGLDSAPDLVWRLLANHPTRWLLIVDNADDTRLLTPSGEPPTSGRGWIRPPHTRRGAVLITSREGNLAAWTIGHLASGKGESWCRMYRVGMLTPADGAQVLLDHTGSHAGSATQAAALSIRLGGLPLALNLAGRYLVDARRMPLPGAATTFADYVAALDSGGISAVFGHQVTSSIDGQVGRLIERTWELSLDLLGDRGHPQARNLLGLLSLLADSPIPYQLLDLKVLARSAVFSSLDIGELLRLLRALAGLGLIESDDTDADPGPATLRIHPLIRDASRHHLHITVHHADCIALAVQLTAAASTGDPDDASNWPNWRLLAPHAQHLLTVAADAAHIDRASAEVAARTARRALRYWAAVGQSAVARKQANSVHDLCQRLLGPDHVDTLAVRNDMADWTGQFENPAAARDLYAKLLSAWERVLGTEHPDALAVRAKLADWTGRAGHPAAARDQYRQILPQWERAWGTADRDILAIHNSLAHWTGMAGDPIAARDAYTALLPVWEQVCGAQHPAVLAVRNNLALWTGHSGDPRVARDQCTKLLPIWERVCGAEHPDTLAVRANLADWTGHAGNPAAARDLYTEVVSIWERICGTEHPDTLAIKANLAHWTGMAGDPAAARDQYTALLPLQEASCGINHLDTLADRRNLAYWTTQADLHATARNQPAQQRLNAAHVPSEHHPHTLPVRYNLAFWSRRSTHSADTANDVIT